MGDIHGLVKLLEEAMPKDRRVSCGDKVSLRAMYEHLQSIMKIGPLDKGKREREEREKREERRSEGKERREDRREKAFRSDKGINTNDY
jgi:hypothetical protein